MKDSHVLFGDNELVCLHCGETKSIYGLPSVSHVVANSQDFVDYHKNCRLTLKRIYHLMQVAEKARHLADIAPRDSALVSQVVEQLYARLKEL